jgi:hypothetical integral membrane protein (TIGR02206 family)
VCYTIVQTDKKQEAGVKVNWIDFGPEGAALEAYTAPHLAAVAVVLSFGLVLFLLRNRFHTEHSRRAFRFAFAAFIALQQASLYIWYTIAGEWSVEVTLPLQLCDLSVFLSVAVLLSKGQLISELLYFWGIGGATQAILTPDIGNYTFPHFVFYQFFISHGVILLACVYMIAVEKFRPSRWSVLRTFGITNLYGLLMLYVNHRTKGNYLFLSYKPSGGSLLDFLGPWPWYLLSLDAVALLIFALLYLPFALGGSSAGSGTRMRRGGTGSSGISA